MKKILIDNEIVEIGVRPGEKIHEVLINEFEIPLTYKLGDIFAISSLIAQYREVEAPVYQTEGEKMEDSMLHEYSSKDHLLSPKEVLEQITSFNLL